MKKLLSILLVLILLPLQTIYASDFDVTSEHIVLYNMNDDEIIYQLNADKQVPIASITKIMTSLVAIEQANNLDEKVTIKSDAFKGMEEYSQAGFEVGDKVSIRDLLYGTMLPSGADAANSIAYHFGGSEAGFAKLMNKKANELGLKNTKFDNAVGKDSINNYSSANDIANLLRYALKNETFKEIFTAREYYVSDHDLELESTLIGYSKSYGLDISKILGSKTGYTDGAGYCLASISRINDIDYLLVVLGSSTYKRYNAVMDSLEIYNYYSTNYDYHTVVDQNECLITIPTKWGYEKEYSVLAQNQIDLYLNNSFNKEKVEYKYEGIEELTYKIKKGDLLGTITVMYEGKELTSFDVYQNDKLKYHHPILYTIILLILVVFTCLVIRYQRKLKRRKLRAMKRRKMS